MTPQRRKKLRKALRTLRSRPGRTYKEVCAHIFAQIEQMKDEVRNNSTNTAKHEPEPQNDKGQKGHTFTQMGAEAGIRTYGKRAVDALFNEFAQLDDLTVFGGLDPRKLTAEQKKNALELINLIKEK